VERNKQKKNPVNLHLFGDVIDAKQPAETRDVFQNSSQKTRKDNKKDHTFTEKESGKRQEHEPQIYVGCLGIVLSVFTCG
jgi:hypothetical protein